MLYPPRDGPSRRDRSTPEERVSRDSPVLNTSVIERPRLVSQVITDLIHAGKLYCRMWVYLPRIPYTSTRTSIDGLPRSDPLCRNNWRVELRGS
jgi:hypothetical protein